MLQRTTSFKKSNLEYASECCLELIWWQIHNMGENQLNLTQEAKQHYLQQNQVNSKQNLYNRYRKKDENGYIRKITKNANIGHLKYASES